MVSGLAILGVVAMGAIVAFIAGVVVYGQGYVRGMKHEALEWASAFDGSNPVKDDAYCECPDWTPCGCGNQPPRHCMYCCHDLSPEQLVAFDFENWEYIPPRPKALPVQIFCGKCGMTIDNPTEADLDFHFGAEHNET